MRGSAGGGLSEHGRPESPVPPNPFFDPSSYLRGDPEAAESARPLREARQRAGLCRSMVEVAARRGYGGATIDEAARLSDFSKATFYKLFESREACSLEAFERCAEEIFRRVAAAGRGGGADFAGQLRAGLGELLQLLAGEPEVARFALVEIRVGGTECREAQQRWLEHFAGLLGDADRGGGAPRSEGLARMTTGALATLLALRVIEKGPEALPEMLEELVYVGLWPRHGAEAEASRNSEAATRAPDEEAPKAVRSRGKAARQVQGRAQRELLLGAMTEAVAAKGYEAARVADVVKRSRLSRQTFYKHFGDKEECFLAAFDAAIKRILERAKAAVAGGKTPAGRTEAGLRVLVESFAEQPAVARLVTIEVRRAGAIGEERYSEALARFAQLIAEAGTHRQAGTASDVPRLVAGTVAGMIAREVGEGRAVQLEGLLPELVFTVLAPCVGGERAAEEMRQMAAGDHAA